MNGQRIFMLAIADLMVVGGAIGWYWGVEQPTFVNLSVISILLPSTALVLGGVFMLGYFLISPVVTLNRESIEWRSLIAGQELFKYDLAGYRRKRRVLGNDQITLIPAESRDQEITVPGYMERDDIFDAWRLSLRDLDEVDADRAFTIPPARTAPDQDTNESSRRSAVGAALAVNVAGAFFSIFVLFLPNPPDVLLLILVVAPCLALIMMIIWPADFRLNYRVGGPRRSLFFLFILPGLALSYRVDADLQLAGWGMPVAAAAAIGLMMAVISRAAYRNSPDRGAPLAVLFILMVPYGFGLTLAINSRLDTSEAQVFHVAVQDKRHTTGSPYSIGLHWLELGPWGKRSTARSITVPGRVYRTVDINTAVCIQLYSGALQMSYFTLRWSCPEQPEIKIDRVLPSTVLEDGIAAYHRGEYQSALKLLRAPAAYGNADAQFFVGLLHWAGKGTARDVVAALEFFDLAAAQGNARAMNAIGYAHDHGIGVPSDVYKAIGWYRKAEAANDPGALANLAILYREGRGVARDDEKAWRLLQKAAELGYGPAMNHLGELYAFGIGVAQDLEKAVGWWTRSREIGNSDAGWYLARYLVRVRATPAEIAEAVPLLREAAEAGNGEAAFVLSSLYGDGRGVTRNPDKQLKWLYRAISHDHPPAMLQRGALHARDGKSALAERFFRMAADKGYPRAQAELGQFYAHKNGVAEDLVKAVKWYARAADQGDALGQRLLAYAYHAGRGVDQNPKEAARLYRLAARQGDAYSADNLAVMLLYGLGIPMDKAEALKWSKMAADQGRPVSMNLLANMLERGDLAGRDLTGALDLYRRAAGHGQANAAHSLAAHYFTGRSIERDVGKAYYWALIAERKYPTAERRQVARLKQAILRALPGAEIDRVGIERRAASFQPLPVKPAPVPPPEPYQAARSR